MEVLEAIRNRRAVRQFKPDIVDDESLKKILDAARWAPSPFNIQPWEFIVIKDKETLKAISKVARYAGYLEAAPMAIAVVVPPIDNKFSWIESIGEPKFAAAIAAQNIMLAAWDMGIGSCWVSTDREKAAKILKLPGKYFLLAVIPIGYPLSESLKPEKITRKPLESMIMYETYGKKP